jgi:hypothetical protein
MAGGEIGAQLDLHLAGVEGQVEGVEIGHENSWKYGVHVGMRAPTCKSLSHG